MLDLYAAAPLQYRGLLIHVSVDGEEFFTFIRVGTCQEGEAYERVTAPTWAELRDKINEQL